jgi:phasin
MSEAAQNNGKSNAFLLPFGAFADFPKFEMPKFEIPKFDSMEVPTAFRDFAEKGIAQAKEGYEKAKAAAEETTDMLEDTFTTATKGVSAYSLKLLEAARANTNASFDLASELLNAKSVAEMVELSTAHARKQFEAMSAQTKELTAFAQKVASDTAEPIKGSVTKVFNKAV